MKFIILFLLSLLALSCSAKSADEWRTRTIYQVLTDRFSRTEDDVTPCTNISDYCGGTFKGIEKNLDYIQGLGANAIWISPIIQNAPGGYHGYWHTNFSRINEHFGTEQDLKDLIKACHERDIWVMVDIVVNHVAKVPNNEDFSSIYPFNETSHYHWPVFKCQDVDKYDPQNQSALDNCWLSYLPDLNHENEFVSNYLLDWIKNLVKTYNIDGLRLDATRHVPKWFWTKFSKAVGIFTVGEAWDEDEAYVAEFQGPIDSLLNCPFHGTLEETYGKLTDMMAFYRHFYVARKSWPVQNVIVNFINNHDLPRFLSCNPNIAHYKTAYAIVLCQIGIPIIYYGDEQNFNGGDDPENREPLWGKMDTNSDMYQFLKRINEFRQRTESYKYDQIQRLGDKHFYAFSRGSYLFAFTNVPNEQTRTIESHPYAEGTLLCNVMKEEDCVEVKDGVFQITLVDNEVKILEPQGEIGKGKCLWNEAKNIWRNVVGKIID